MSRDRPLEFIDGDQGLLIRTLELVQESGARTCEVGHERADGIPLGDDEDVPAGVPVRWYVEATYRHKARGRRPIDRVRRGESDPIPYLGDHRAALVQACKRLLEAGGATVTIVDRAGRLL